MDEKIIKRFIAESIERLKSAKRGFGDPRQRSWSMYHAGAAAFDSYALKVLTQIWNDPYQHVVRLDVDLPPGQERRLVEVLDRIDDLGMLVLGAADPNHQNRLTRMTVRWVQRNIPRSFVQAIDLRQYAALLIQRIRDELTNPQHGSRYDFRVHLFVWAQPLLLHDMRHFLTDARLDLAHHKLIRDVALWTQLKRDRLALWGPCTACGDDLGTRLMRESKTCLDALKEQFGIHRIGRSEVVDRTLLRLFNATEAQLGGHLVGDPDNFDVEWAIDVLRDEIQAQAIAEQEPDFGFPWS